MDSYTKACLHYDLSRVKVVANPGPLIDENIRLFIGDGEHPIRVVE